MDYLEEVRRYVNSQKMIFGGLPLKNDFNAGIIEGLNLVEVYLNLRIENQAIDNARRNDVAPGK